VPSVSSSLTVTVSKIDSSSQKLLQSGINMPIDFGTLNFDSVNGIFLPTVYYSVDIGVVNNTGSVWTLTHTANSIKKDATNNLDSNVNVTFVKQADKDTGGTLRKVSYANSNSVATTSTELGTGWLRIYYGIGSGSGDATGVTPIGINKPAGIYSGSVVITLTP